MRRNAILALTLALLAACETPVSAPTLRPSVTEPSLAVIENRKMTFAFTDTDPCTGELIAFERTDHVVTRSSEDGAGGIHFGTLFHINAHGVGASGAQYTMNHVSTSQAYVKLPFSGTVTFPLHTRVIRQGEDGSTDDFLMKFLWHVTATPNAETNEDTTVNFIHEGNECR